MFKIKNLLALGVALSLALSVDAQNSEDAPVTQKKTEVSPVVQKVAQQNVPANDPMSAASTGPNLNRPGQVPAKKQTVEDKIQEVKPVVSGQAVVQTNQPPKVASGQLLPFADRGGVNTPDVELSKASQKGTSQDPDAKPVPAAATQKGNEGGSAVTPVQSAVVKAPAKDAVVPQGKAPVAPAAIEEKTSDAGNSTNGEKPAQVPPAKQQ